MTEVSILRNATDSPTGKHSREGQSERHPGRKFTTLSGCERSTSTMSRPPIITYLGSVGTTDTDPGLCEVPRDFGHEQCGKKGGAGKNRKQPPSSSSFTAWICLTVLARRLGGGQIWHNRTYYPGIVRDPPCPRSLAARVGVWRRN